jgi:hypothetical protein
MQKPTSQAPELKALLAHIDAKISPAKRLRVRAENATAEIIARAQRQSRLKK